MAKKKTMNGRLQLYRFLFAILIVLFHANKYIYGEPNLKDARLALAPHGSMGVEFFFLLSGFLMAKSAFHTYTGRIMRTENKFARCADDCRKFLQRKVRALLPEHTVAYAIALAVAIIAKGATGLAAVNMVVDNVPGFFLLQMTGLKLQCANHLEWYMSAMLIAMATIYPLCRSNYFAFTRYIAPVMSIIALGWLYQETGGSLTGVSDWLGFCYKGMLRGWIEISLGTTAYEVSRCLTASDLKAGTKRLLGVVEAACVGLEIMYILVSFPKKYEYYALAGMFCIVSICGAGIGSGPLFDNAITRFLGKASYPIYLAQLPVIVMVQTYMATEPKKVQIVSVVVGTFALAALIALCANVLFRKRCVGAHLERSVQQ